MTEESLRGMLDKASGSAEDSLDSSPVFALAGCVTLRKSFNLSVAPFLGNEMNITILTSKSCYKTEMRSGGYNGWHQLNT